MDIEQYNKFKNSYPKFKTLLGAWFAVDYCEKTDEEILFEYADVYSNLEIKELLDEIDEVKLDIDDWFERICNEANRIFEHKQEMINWLEKIEKYLVARIE